MVVATDKYKLTRCTPFALKVRRVYFCVIGNFVPITQKRRGGMRTAEYNADESGCRRRKSNVKV